MSEYVDRREYDDRTFSLGDRVSFISPWGERIIGEVVRVYNSRVCYHVEVDGERYFVRTDDSNQDGMQMA